MFHLPAICRRLPLFQRASRLISPVASKPLFLKATWAVEGLLPAVGLKLTIAVDTCRGHDERTGYPVARISSRTSAREIFGFRRLTMSSSSGRCS